MTTEKFIAGIPASNIEAIKMYEVAFRPFRLKKYIEQNIKEYIEDDIIEHFLFMNPQFEKDLVFIDFLKDGNYLFDENSRLTNYIVYKEDIKTLPRVIMVTNDAIEISGKDNDNYIFKFSLNMFTGQPDYPEITQIFDQLVTYCYGVKTKDDFFSKAYASKNPLLIHFAENYRLHYSEAFHELIELLNRQELNPNITYNDIIYGQTLESF